ncbi:hypothetical protein GOBAR_DD05768 [Gossypium barbadense]|nr:hypothetical protein GOBAR_DD05768 [Gossypium barbadense]
MIRAIRACKTAAEERAVVRKECAAIRAAINENDQDYRHRNLAKLMFIHMLGYPTHFGQMECLKLIASTGFPEKRIGYLGLMLLLDERQEVLMLVTNSLKQYPAQMARDLAPDVERLLQFRDPNIRKKAALCSIRIIKKVPDLAENFMHPASSLLKEKHHGVLITGVQLCTDLCKVSSEALEYFREVASRTESNKNAGNAILYECVETIMSIEDNGGLRVLAINILGRFLSNRDNNIRYVGLNMLMKAIMVDAKAVQRHRATILECVKDSDASIQKRALELVYLLVNESNVKPLTKELIEYLELNKKCHFSFPYAVIFFAVVLYALSSWLNISCMMLVLWMYLAAYSMFSPAKIWYIDQMLKVLSEAGNFVKDEVWHALIIVISNASDLHGYTVRALYRVFQASTEQESLVRVAVWCVGEYGDMLVNNVGMLDIEEPITVTESDAVDAMEVAIKCQRLGLTTKAMALIALFKLSSRFPSCSERIKDIIVQNKRSLVLELQQRSIEFSCILQKHQNIRSALVERMPILDEATFTGRKAGSLPTAVSASSIIPCNLPNGIAKPAAAPIGDLLDLSSDDAPPAPVSSGGDFLQDLLGVDLSPASAPSVCCCSSSPATILHRRSKLPKVQAPPLTAISSVTMAASSYVLASPVANLNGLASHSSLSANATSPASSAGMMDLLNGTGAITQKHEENGPAYPSLVAYESSTLRMTFNFSKQPGNPQTTFIQATFTNLSPNVYNGFLFQAAVPKFLQLHLDPASSNTLPASVLFKLGRKDRKFEDGKESKKSLVMRIRIAYKTNDKDVLEEGQINNFPRDL